MKGITVKVFIYIYLILFFFFPSIVLSAQKDLLIVKKVNKSLYDSRVTTDGYTYARLIGNVQVEYDNKSIFADEVKIKFRNKKAITAVFRGNVIIKYKDKTTLALSAFVYIPEKTLLVQEASIIQQNMFVHIASSYRDDKGLIIFNNPRITTSHYLYPHYKIEAQKAWVDNENDLLLTNAIFNIGQDTLLYFPVIYIPGYGAGIITNIAYDYYLGTSINNTYVKEADHYKEKFMFDYYQKLGEYVANDYSRNDIGELNTHIALAYDKHVKYENGEFINYFEQVMGEGPSTGRSLRYHFDIDYNYDILGAEDMSDVRIGIHTHYKELSDPNFETQFETDRKDTFDISNLFFPSAGDISRAGSSSLIGVEGRLLELGLNSDFYGYHFEINTSASYELTPNNSQSGPINTFAASYYKNTLESLILPDIILSKEFDLYTVNKHFSDGSDFTMPINLSLSNHFRDQERYQPEGLENEDIMNSFTLSLAMPITYQKNWFEFSLPFSWSNDLEYNNMSFYDYQRGSLLEGMYDQVNYTTTVEYSPDFNFSLYKNLNMSINSNLSTQYMNRYQKTQNATTEQKLNDNNNTYYTIEQAAGASLILNWENENEYFQGNLSFIYRHDYSLQNGKNLIEEQKYHSNRDNYTLTLNALKTNLEIQTYNQKGNKILKEYEDGPLDVRLEFQSIPYLNIIEGYHYDRYYKGSINNNLEFQLEVPTNTKIFSWLSFSQMLIDIQWENDFNNVSLSNLYYSFQFSFNITRYWLFSFSLNGRNNQLFLYSNGTKNFWADLWDSLKLWDTEARTRSSFKMESLTVKLEHDLDEWSLEAGFNFEPELARTGTYYFKTEFYFMIKLKDLSMLSAPAIRKTSDNGEQY